MQITKYKLNSKLVSRNYRIVMLSDLHNRPFDEIVSLVKTESPDFILIVGDLVDRHRKWYDRMLPFIAACVKIAPTFFSYGNHEVKLPRVTKEEIVGTGAILLDNSFIETDDFAIGGQTPCADFTWISQLEKSPKFKLLMCHNPEYYPSHLKNKNLDLIVSGHAHGGQIRIFGKGILSPGQGFFPKYSKGFIDNKLIVGTGLANTGGIVPRIGNPTEIVEIEISKL